MNPSSGSGESIRAEFGLSEASVAQAGPSVLARIDVGVDDTILVRGGEADILGHSARDFCLIWWKLAGTSEHFE